MPYVRPLLDAGVDRIVLACTHFLHLEPDFASACADCGADCGDRRVEIVDSLEGVARRLASLCLAEEPGASAEVAGAAVLEPQAHRGRFFLTQDGPIDPSYTAWALRFSLSFPEVL